MATGYTTSWRELEPTDYAHSQTYKFYRPTPRLTYKVFFYIMLKIFCRSYVRIQKQLRVLPCVFAETFCLSLFIKNERDSDIHLCTMCWPWNPTINCKVYESRHSMCFRSFFLCLIDMFLEIIMFL